jgi:signal peptidase II
MLKKVDWTIVILPLFFTWGIDRLTKIWAESEVRGVVFHGPLGFVLHHNHGAMLGLFSDLPPVLRIVTLSTGGAFLLFSFAVIQYLLPIKSLPLRSGMSILIGGILGNVTDRILNGYVTDFILLGRPDAATPAFNMADALQWVGYGMIAWALVRESELLWPVENTRKANWVNLRFQLRYCFILIGVGLGFAVISGVFSYTFLRVTIIDLIGNNQRLLEHYLLPFTLTFVVVSLSFALILVLVGRVLSGRIAGPVYAFEKFLDDLLSGRPRALRLRAGDEFKHLEKLAARLVQLAAEGHMGAKSVVNGVASGIASGITPTIANAAPDTAVTSALAVEPSATTVTSEANSVATVTELTQPIEALSANVILSKK